MIHQPGHSVDKQYKHNTSLMQCDLIRDNTVRFYNRIAIMILVCFPDNPAVQLVVVEIGDKNDNPPHFTKPEYTGGK